MDDTRKFIDELLQKLAMNQITCDELARRLAIAIETEYLKREPRLDFINTCEDLLWELGTQGQQSFTSANDRYLSEINRAIIERGKAKVAFSPVQRFAIIAIALLLIIFSGYDALQFKWFTHETQSNGEIHIIQGHEVTIELIQAALAEHDAYTTIKTNDFNEVCAFLGFTPSLISPESLSANTATYFVTIESGLVILDTRYSDSADNSIAVLKIEYYLDPEEAYFMLQQDTPGEYVNINGQTIYYSTNIDRQSYAWLGNSTLITLSGYIEREHGLQIIEELIRRYYDD